MDYNKINVLFTFFIDKQHYPVKDIKDIYPKFTYNVSTMNSEKFPVVETCPSICGSTDDDITDILADVAEPTNTSTHSNNNHLSDNESTEQDNYFKTPAKHKNFKNASRHFFFQNESPSSIDIRDSDCEMATLSNPKEKFKTKVFNIVNKAKKRKRTTKPVEEYVGEKRLKFVNIEDSDCEMSLYSKTKQNTKVKKRKSKDKQSKGLAHVKNMSNSLTISENLNNGQSENNTPLETMNFVNIKNKDRREFSLVTRTKKKATSETDVDKFNYDFWKKNLETRKSIFVQNEKNKHTNNIFLSVDQMNWGDQNDISEDTKKIKFVDIRDSDCEISILTKTKKKKKKRSKHRKDKINVGNGNIENSEIKTDSDLEKYKEKDKNQVSRDTHFANKTIENLIKNETYYDFKFNNMEEIKKDFDISGISFEEDLSIIEHNNSLPPKNTIKKEENIIKTLPENLHKVPHILKTDQKPRQLKNVIMPDLDVTKLSVLVDLKSVKENSLNLKSPKKNFKTGNTENKVFIEVSYSDSSKYEQNWSIGIRNIEENNRSTVGKALNINEDEFIERSIKNDCTEQGKNNWNKFKENEVQDKIGLVSNNDSKNRNLANIDYDVGNFINVFNNCNTNVSTLKEISKEIKANEEKCDEVKMCNSKCETANLHKDILESSSLQQIVSSEFDSEEFPMEKAQNQGQNSDYSDASDLQHPKNAHVQSTEYDADDIFKDELKSNIVDNRVKYPDDISNGENKSNSRESQEETCLEEVKKNNEVGHTFEETGAIAKITGLEHAQEDQIEETGKYFLKKFICIHFQYFILN